jgi:hypothetical protein
MWSRVADLTKEGTGNEPESKLTARNKQQIAKLANSMDPKGLFTAYRPYSGPIHSSTRTH